MTFKTEIALSAAIVLGTAVTAAAGAKHHKIANPQGGPHAQAAVPRTPQVSDPKNNPLTTGGGSLGYNQNNYNDW